MEKGEGKGVGWGMELVGGVPGKGVARGRWNTEQGRRREEELFTKVIGIFFYQSLLSIFVINPNFIKTFFYIYIHIYIFFFSTLINTY